MAYKVTIIALLGSNAILQIVCKILAQKVVKLPNFLTMVTK